MIKLYKIASFAIVIVTYKNPQTLFHRPLFNTKLHFAFTGYPMKPWNNRFPLKSPPAKRGKTTTTTRSLSPRPSLKATSAYLLKGHRVDAL